MEELTSSPLYPSMGDTTPAPHLSIEETPQPLNFSMEETSSPVPPNLSTGETPPPLNLSMDETPLPPNLCMQKNPPPSTNSFMEERPPPSTNSSMGETSPSYTNSSMGETSPRQSTNSPMEETSVQYTNSSMEATSPPSAPRIVVIPHPLIARGVVMEPMFAIPGRAGPTRWSTSLFGCCSDVDNCCMTCFCPCVTFGQIAEIIDGGSSSCCGSGACYAGIMCLTGCQCLYSCFYRSKMRGQFFLEESPCVDCCVHCCCEPCALCQEYRELRNRGLDPQFGWNGNLVRQMAMIHPSVVRGMTR